MRSTKVLSLSIPPELLREVERAAKREGRSKSELFRAALRRYLAAQRLRSLQAYGTRQARTHRIAESDVERLIQEYRTKR